MRNYAIVNSLIISHVRILWKHNDTDKNSPPTWAECMTHESRLTTIKPHQQVNSYGHYIVSHCIADLQTNTHFSPDIRVSSQWGLNKMAALLQTAVQVFFFHWNACNLTLAYGQVEPREKWFIENWIKPQHCIQTAFMNIVWIMSAIF